MRMHNKVLLALACTAALSACDGEKIANEIQKQTPLIMQEPGLYQAQLLSGTANTTFNMLADLDGVALIYPKGESKQYWGVWVDNTDSGVVTRSQWLGEADQTLPDGSNVYGVRLTRDSERFKESGGLPTGEFNVKSTHNLISFKDQTVRDVEGKEVKRWVFDFNRVGTDFSATPTAPKSPLYPQWEGFVALNPVPGGTKLIEAGNWVSIEDQGYSNAMTGKVETVIAAGDKLSVLLEMPAAGCTLLGSGEKPIKGLNKLTFNLRSPAKGSCVFDDKVDGLFEKKWTKALERAQKTAGTITAYTTAFTAAGRDQLVIGFPEVAGFMLTAGKQ